MIPNFKAYIKPLNQIHLKTDPLDVPKGYKVDHCLELIMDAYDYIFENNLEILPWKN